MADTGHMDQFFGAVGKVFTGPVVWFRENVATPYRKDYPWYHRRYRRVPGIEDCYIDDWVCREEANAQFDRDQMVERKIVGLLSKRYEHCVVAEGVDSTNSRIDPNAKCHDAWIKWSEANLNFYIKYGDMKYDFRAEDTLMKQKHRMIWERRNGPMKMSGEAHLTS